MLSNRCVGRRLLWRLSVCVLFVAGAVALGWADFDKKAEDAFYVAAKSYEDGFYDTSLTLFDQFLKDHFDSPKRVEAVVYIGQAYFQQEKYLKALNQFESAAKMEGTDLIRDKILFWLGEVFAKGKDERQAKKFYQEVIDGYPQSSYRWSAYLRLAGMAMVSGRFQEAEEIYNQIISEKPASAIERQARLGICEALYRAKDFPRLKADLQRLIADSRQDDDTAMAYFYLGEACFYQQQYREAIDAYDRIVQSTRDPRQKEAATVGMGWSYLKLKEYDEAQRIFTSFAEDNPPLSVVLGRAVLAAASQQYQQSLDLFEKVLIENTTGEYLPLACFGKAEALYNLSRFDQSIVAYRTALDKLKGIPLFYSENKDLRDKIYYGLAWAYLKTGDFRSAQENFQRVASGSDDKTVRLSALCQLGDSYQDTGDFEKALATYNELLQDDPDSLYADYVQYQIAMTLWKKHDDESAVLALRKLLRDAPKSKLVDEALYSMGAIYFQQGQFGPAAEELRPFVTKMKDSSYRAEALFLLGESLLNVADYPTAIDVFEILLKDYKQDASHLSLLQKAEYEIANAFAQMGNEAEANRRLNDFTNRYPDSQLSPDIIFWLGQSLLVRKDYASSLHFFERLVRNYPSHELLSEAYLQMGLASMAQDAFDRAIRYFESARALGKPDIRFQSWLHLGDCYYHLSDFENALKHYEEAAQVKDVSVRSAYVKIADLYYSVKNYPKAIAALERALSVPGEESEPELQFRVGEWQQDQGDWSKAVAAYLQVYYRFSEDRSWAAKALLRVAKIYEDRENWKEFKSVLEKLVKLDVPESAYARDKLAEISDDKGNNR